MGQSHQSPILPHMCIPVISELSVHASTLARVGACVGGWKLLRVAGCSQIHNPPPTSHSQGESRSLRKQLQEVVLRLDESREKTGDAHFMVEALRNEQDRLMRDHNAALDGAMAELEMLRRG